MPVPLRGWRQFAGEVGVIVLGVLIALFVQQMADEWQWRLKTEQARKDISQELAVNYGQAYERVQTQACMISQLNHLETVVLQSTTTLKPVPEFRDSDGYSAVYRAPNRNWLDTAWRSHVADGAASRLGRDNYIELASYYAGIPILQELNDASTEAVGSLSVLTNAIEVDAGVKADLLQTIARERARTRTMALRSRQLMEAIASLGYAPDQKEISNWMRGESRTIKWCETNRD